jgi:nitrous oxide reductase accessory protein NosL
MKLLALLTLAATLVLLGCSKSEETAAPKAPDTNAPAK